MELDNQLYLFYLYAKYQLLQNLSHYVYLLLLTISLQLLMILTGYPYLLLAILPVNLIGQLTILTACSLFFFCLLILLDNYFLDGFLKLKFLPFIHNF